MSMLNFNRGNGMFDMGMPRIDASLGMPGNNMWMNDPSQQPWVTRANTPEERAAYKRAAEERRKEAEEKKKNAEIEKARQATRDAESKQTGWDSNFGPASTTAKQALPPTQTINPLAYSMLIQDFNRFRAIAHSESDMYDMPGQVFFRVLFHFDNGSDAREAANGTWDADFASGNEENWTGLIAPSWYEFDEAFDFNANSESDIEKLWRSSTAFNYFVLNGDIQRAKLTKQFVELLSSISANSPWYFQNIKGLDAAIERNIATQNAEFEFKAERDKITIECLDDSYDQRIGTLLDLYRAIVWSWETKRQMLPVNLRKFDMTIIAFQMPLRGKHISRRTLNMGRIENELISDNAKNFEIHNIVDSGGVTQVYTSDSTAPIASFKAWEFHGCEIDYNSSKSGWSELDNAAGSVPKYSIDIFFDDVFETRFNEFTSTMITDVIGDDIPYSFDGKDLFPTKASVVNETYITKPYTEPGSYPELQGPQQIRTNMFKGDANSAALNKVLEANMFGTKKRKKSSILDQAIGAGKEWAKTKLKKIYLGNMNGLSISKINRQVNQALDGDLWATVYNIKNYIRGDYDGGHLQLGSNIFPKPEPQSPEKIIELGNIFRANTTLNT